MSEVLSRYDLKYQYHVGKTLPEHPKLQGNPNGLLFDRQELYEVLYLLNKVADAKGYHSPAEAAQLEYKLLRAPDYLHSQSALYRWLVNSA